MAAGRESLESWLNKATSPSNREEDWENIMGFCNQINKELEGPQISVRLLVHKIHSPQEWEALQALMVLGACMKNCGQRFQNEVGKFRFLNELIKVISPKYLGDKVSEKVRSKVIKMIYSWTIYLPEETKIFEAYQMLKTQGIVLADPEIPLDAALAPSSSEKPKNPVFDDEHKSRKLAELLKSKKPTDLQEANQLIKNMVKEDELRTQKASKQSSTVEAVNNSVKLLNEMLTYFSPESSTDGDKDLIRELYSECNKLRQTVCQLATETDDNDTYLGDILQANDDLSNVINSYKKIMEGQTINGDSKTLSAVTQGLNGLVTNESEQPRNMSNYPQPFQICSQDVDHFDTTSPAGSAFFTIPPSSSSSVFDSLFPSALLPSVTLQQPPVGPVSSSRVPMSPPQSQSTALLPPATVHVATSQISTAPQPSQSEPPSLGHSLQDIALLDFSSCKRGPEVHFDNAPAKRDGTCSPANHLCQGGLPNCPPDRCQADNVLLHSLNPIIIQSQNNLDTGEEASLANVFVPLEAVRPSKLCPVTVYDESGVHVLLHFARDCPPGRPDVLVIVASMLNTSPLPVSDIVLQAAVPKTMKVKLQPPSGTRLAPFNPIAPTAVISQVMLLSNPHKEKVRMRFKLTFTLGEQHHTDVGEVNDFPSPDRWGVL
ncbi:ADP-ribosylation factor-binding protein GGA3a isoform X4 [Dunckerocampus dactyliophorus]|uniref:ADP-ribosylation factor-binding protein GGA3a isoform X4 n=1 Tax=Dunckerocampus dactyliophorus TaxID=161453 RepID=UPI002405DEC1|nr:ADP-ribosylation factor-binding protein GGA3a isoform X4 [Dunckerocampus dactyliophorus]